MRFLLLIPYVTLWPWPLTHWSLTSVVDWVSCEQITTKFDRDQLNCRWVIDWFITAFSSFLGGAPKQQGFEKGMDRSAPILVGTLSDHRHTPSTKQGRHLTPFWNDIPREPTIWPVSSATPTAQHQLDHCYRAYTALSVDPLPVRQRINFKLAKLCYLVTSFK